MIRAPAGRRAAGEPVVRGAAGRVGAEADDGPDLVPVLGPLHGALFVALVLLVLASLERLRWSWWFTLLMLTIAGGALRGPYDAHRMRPPAGARAAAGAERGGGPADRNTLIRHAGHTPHGRSSVSPGGATV